MSETHCIRECTPCQSDMADMSNELATALARIETLTGERDLLTGEKQELLDHLVEFHGCKSATTPFVAASASATEDGGE